MKKETRRWVDMNDIEHQATDCYSNARSEYEASKCILGRSLSKEEYLEEKKYNHLIIEDGGNNGRYYVAYID